MQLAARRPNAGILSTATLGVVRGGVGASGAAIVTAASAGLLAGALSMAAGEYLSVSSQRDAQQDDIRLDAREPRRDPGDELRELAGVLWWPPGKINGRYLTP